MPNGFLNVLCITQFESRDSSNSPDLESKMKKAVIYGLSHELFLSQFREDQVFKQVSDSELEDDLYQADALDSIRARFGTVSKAMLNDLYTDLYRDLEGYFTDGHAEIFLDLTPLWDTPEEWWRDSVMPESRAGTPIRLRQENRERLRAILSIHRAAFPQDSILWGIRPVNDNEGR